MNRRFCLFFLLLSHVAAHSQRGNNWVFGGNAWVNFSTTPPATGTSAMFQLEGSSSISDMNGNLLFYSDGLTVWNADHEIMPNGSSLYGNFSSTQSSMIVPFPEDPKRYYLFTMDVFGGPHGLSYSVVNMDLDNGMGDIEIKNIFLVGPSSEKVTSVNHCNGKDVWVMTATANSDKFYAYLVTAAGVQSPVISSSTAPTPYFSLGYLKFSPDGTRMACANLGKGMDLYDFDATTGVVSNRKSILSGSNQHTYGIEFSPNSKLLYIANTVRVGNDSRFDVSQYSKIDEDLATILATRVELDNDYFSNAPVGLARFGALQLGPDYKLYVSDYFTGLHVINKPDRVGPACNYVRNGQPLAVGTRTTYGLPDFNQSYFKGSFTYSISCIDNEVKFYFTKQGGATSVKWDFGDPASGVNNTSVLDSPIHVFTNPGIYEVKVISYLPCRTDTLKKTISVGPLKVNLGPDKLICSNDPFTIIPHLQGTANSYVWQDGSTNPTFVASNSGLYWVEIQNTENGCIARDSIQLTMQSKPVVDLGIDTAVCERATYLLDAGNPGASYLWQDNSTDQTFTVKKGGTYFVKVNLNGCETSDTVKIRQNYQVRVFLGNDTAICDGMTIQLRPVLKYADGAGFLWNTGEIGPNIPVTQPGTYTLYATNECGLSGDEIVVKPGVCKIFVPTGFTPNNDGRNDIFKPGYGENISSYRMEIYNRWGQKVFESNQLQYGWDGKLKGVLQPNGVFAWYIRYKIFNDPIEYSMKGTLMLIY